MCVSGVRPGKSLGMAKSDARTRQGGDETLEMDAGTVVPDLDIRPQPAPPTLHRSHVRPFGAHPVPLLGGVGGLALVAAVVLLADGAIVGGLVVLILAIPVLGLFVGGVMREPEAPVARPTLRAVDRGRSVGRLVSVISRTWGGASFELVRIRLRRYRLRRELKASLEPLGEAVHHGDRERADAFKRRAAALESELVETERENAAVIGRVRREIERERTGIEPTEALRLSGAPDRKRTFSGHKA